MNILRRRWRQKDIISFLERLSLYLSAGMTLSAALDAVSLGDPRRAADVHRIKSDVESGMLLSRAMRSRMPIALATAGLIEHGERSGGIATALGSARAILERGDELKRKCMSAMAYPVVIGAFSLLVTVGLVRGVMPQIVPMLRGLNVPLPILTRAVIGASEWLIAYGLWTFLTACIVVVVGGYVYKRYSRIRFMAHRTVAKIPLIRTSVARYHLSIFLYSCGSLIDSGVGVDTAYGRTASTVVYEPVARALRSADEGIARGASIGKTLAGEALVPLFVPALISAGEATGTLGNSMKRAAALLDRDLEHGMKQITSLLEPTMMAAMGTVVGAIAISIMMPIYDISKTLQR